VLEFVIALSCDDKYIDEDMYKKHKEFIPRMFLHNIFLGFTDNNFPYKFTIPLPTDLSTVLNNITEKRIFKDIYDLNYLFNVKIDNSKLNT
jgi:hypothetical protein